MEEAFQGWTSHGQAYFRQMLAHLKRSQTDAFSETNAFLVDILVSLLSTNADGIDKNPAPDWVSDKLWENINCLGQLEFAKGFDKKFANPKDSDHFKRLRPTAIAANKLIAEETMGDKQVVNCELL